MLLKLCFFIINVRFCWWLWWRFWSTLVRWWLFCLWLSIILAPICTNATFIPLLIIRWLVWLILWWVFLWLALCLTETHHFLSHSRDNLLIVVNYIFWVTFFLLLSLFDLCRVLWLLNWPLSYFTLRSVRKVIFNVSLLLWTWILRFSLGLLLRIMINARVWKLCHEVLLVGNQLLKSIFEFLSFLRNLLF